VRARLWQARYAVELLLERRLWLFVALDAFLLLERLIAVLVIGGKVADVYRSIAVLPMILIGLPATSTAVALERRAGSLDLALAVPSTEGYFVRRVAPVVGFLTLQAWLVLSFAADGWELVRALLQSAVVGLLVGALALFWAVRLTTAGGVFVASLVSVGLLGGWIFSTPVIDRSGPAADRFAGVPLPLLGWGWDVLVLLLAAVILYQYARVRLRRPETLLVG
jgi:hypothetical protein